MLKYIEENGAIKALLAAFLGFIFLNFLFTIAFGTGSTVNQLVSLLNLVINILVFGLTGAFFYGIYNVIRDNAEPLRKQIISFLPESKRCSKCQQGLHDSWMFCPSCMEKVEVLGKVEPLKEAATVLTQTCKKCGQGLEDSWRICPYCGENQADEAA